jgi:hypothetical protein
MVELDSDPGIARSGPVTVDAHDPDRAAGGKADLVDPRADSLP